jgi:hypothetical protein
MLLRRLTQSLKEQNWTAIVVEFVLLVLGVFLGIQVSNWNQAREDQHRGRAYVTRLTADFEQDLALRRQLVDYYGAVLDSVERTDSLLADPRADPKTLVIAAYRATEVNNNPSLRATWDEIVSSGDIGLLPRDVVRLATTYYAFDTSSDAYAQLLQSAYRHRVRNIIPLAIQKAMRTGCSDARNSTQTITGFVPACKLNVAPETITVTAAALRADPLVRENLRYQYSDVYSAHANLQGDVAVIEQALAAIKHRPAHTRASP